MLTPFQCKSFNTTGEHVCEYPGTIYLCFLTSVLKQVLLSKMTVNSKEQGNAKILLSLLSDRERRPMSQGKWHVEVVLMSNYDSRKQDSIHYLGY